MRLIVDQAVRWFLLSGRPLAIGALTAEFRPGVRDLADMWRISSPGGTGSEPRAARRVHCGTGLPWRWQSGSLFLNTLSTAIGYRSISPESAAASRRSPSFYFAAATSFGLLTLRRQARVMPAGTQSQSLTADALIDDSYAQQREIVPRQLLLEGSDDAARDAWGASELGRDRECQAILTDVARTFRRRTLPCSPWRAARSGRQRPDAIRHPGSTNLRTAIPEGAPMFSNPQTHRKLPD